jgi:pimeloyl-ACP methyl ester carboxylesterase
MENPSHATLSHYTMPDGAKLAMEVFKGRADFPQLLFLHGFGQNRLAFSASAKSLSQQGFSCWNLDGRGHGDSDWCAPAGYELDVFVEDALHVLGLMRAAAPGAPTPIVVGASMGGLIGLLCAAKVPGAVGALALIDVTPRWEAAGVDRIFAFMRANPDGFADLAAANDAVLAYQPQREAQDPNRLRAHLRVSPDGRFRWHWDPQLLPKITEAAQSYTPILERAAAKVRCPVLLLSGGRSDVVSNATIESFMKQVPHATHRQIASATHRVVGDSNQVFTDAMLEFLSQFTTAPPVMLALNQAANFRPEAQLKT